MLLLCRFVSSLRFSVRRWASPEVASPYHLYADPVMVFALPLPPKLYTGPDVHKPQKWSTFSDEFITSTQNQSRHKRSILDSLSLFISSQSYSLSILSILTTTVQVQTASSPHPHSDYCLHASSSRFILFRGQIQKPDCLSLSLALCYVPMCASTHCITGQDC